MFPELLARLILTAGILVGGILLYRVFNHLILRRSPIYPLAQPGLPAILYFTTPSCIPCKTIQRPAIQSVRQQLGERLQVIEVDAENHPDLASHWHVMSVPTTYILDAHGRPRYVNHGVTDSKKLLQQLEEIV